MPVKKPMPQRKPIKADLPLSLPFKRKKSGTSDTHAKDSISNGGKASTNDSDAIKRITVYRLFIPALVFDTLSI